MLGLQQAKEDHLKAIQQDDGFAILGMRRRLAPGQNPPETVWDCEFRWAFHALRGLSGEESLACVFRALVGL